MSRQIKLAIEALEQRSLPSSNPIFMPVDAPMVNAAAVSQSASNQMLSETIPILQSLNNTLANSDRDYNSHRTEAVVDIGLAEKQLGSALDYVGQTTIVDAKPTRTDTGSHPEAQTVSDIQLTTVVTQLQAEINVLQQADNDYGGHRLAAIRDLQAAMVQLNQALAYSATHNQNQS